MANICKHSRQTIDVDRDHLVRYLADLGKASGAHDTIAKAEATYAAGSYDNILSDRQNPHADINGNLRAMRTRSPATRGNGTDRPVPAACQVRAGAVWNLGRRFG
ncbi:hypothetical protein [Actinoplanes regularis]|uniref:Uncharacterized protein n=1 Tax=Actinoplanes regularis TaxID=52697 RepID=A0A239IWK6_9ACTN|nr:hypothetical protein [Actinoplanes regularis]GIE91604.1 hypothetical protein Are01nite_80840 [Actinoplanes regularis]SNS97915.1 hypothetical protein SAMN06264365_13144 [Actinoplanes regularis]